MARVSEPPFVGRSPELAELRAGLATAVAGSGSLFTIAGDAGIGKSRLAAQLAHDATQVGASTVWGIAWEAGGAPAFWPWIQVVRALAEPLDEAELHGAVRTGGPYLARLVPELRERLPDPTEPPALETEQARFNLYDAVAEFLRAATTQHPLVVVLDDLHAADQPSLLMLMFAARMLRDAPVVLVGTHRQLDPSGQPEVGRLLAELERVGTHLPLRGLTQAELRELVSVSTPEAMGAADRLHAITEGNPFFLDEMVRLMRAAGQLGQETAEGDEPALPLPEGVRETIRRRLEPLSQEAVDALTVAAVLGRSFSLAALAAATGLPRPQLLETLDDAARLNLVVEARPEPGRYEFGHALIRETLYEDLAPSRRAALHGSVGEALETLYGDTPERHAGELAHHFLAAGEIGSAKALDYAVRAADRAMSTLAYEHAARLYGAALAASQWRPLDEADRWELLVALGRAQMRAGSVALARETLTQAAESARSLGDAGRLARTALEAAPWGLAIEVLDEQLVALLEEALAGAPAEDSTLRARLMAALARQLYYSSQPSERRFELGDEAIALAREAGDAAALARVLGDVHIATWDPDSPTRSLPWADEMISLGERVGDRELVLDAHNWRISLLLELGEIDAVDRGLATFARLAEESGQPRAQTYVELHGGMRALIDGRFSDVERAVARGSGMSSAVGGDEIVTMLMAGQAFVMRWLQGRLDEVEPAVRGFAAAYPAIPAWRCALVATLLDTGNEAELRREFQRLAAAGFELPRDNGWLVSLVLLSEACAHLDDADSAARLAQLLEPYAQRNAVAPACALLGPVAHSLAILATVRGRFREALEHAQVAREMATAVGAQPVLAKLCLDEARALLGRSSDGDEREAQRLVEECVELATSLGMDRLVAAAGELVEPGAARTRQEEEVAERARLERRGDHWNVSFSGDPFTVRDAKGLHHLARLLAQPDVEIHALDLASGSVRSEDRKAEQVEPDSVHVGADHAGAALDTEAKEAYRSRIEDLREEHEEAELFNDPERAARAREELEFIRHELAAAVGLGGRDRKAASSAERARVNVTRAIKTSIERIAAYDQPLGRHLETAVRTGTFCVYRPEPGGPSWQIELETAADLR